MSHFKAGSVMRVLFVIVPMVRSMLGELEEKLEAGKLDRADLEAIVAVALIEAQGHIVELFNRHVDDE